MIDFTTSITKILLYIFNWNFGGIGTPYIMEYICPVWFLYIAENINTLEHIQLHAARWAAGSRWNPSSYVGVSPLMIV